MASGYRWIRSPSDCRLGARADVAGRAGAQAVHVFFWCTGDFGSVGHHADIARRGQAALPGVNHVQPRQHRLEAGVRRRCGAPGIGSSCGCRARSPPSDRGSARRPWSCRRARRTRSPRIFDDGGQRTFPADVLAAERQPPAVQPPSSRHRRMGRPLQHLLWMHVGSVGGVQRHQETLRLLRTGFADRLGDQPPAWLALSPWQRAS